MLRFHISRGYAVAQVCVSLAYRRTLGVADCRCASHAAAKFVAASSLAVFWSRKPLTTITACISRLPAPGQVQVLHRNDLGQQGAADGCAHSACCFAAPSTTSAVCGSVRQERAWAQRQRHPHKVKRRWQCSSRLSAALADLPSGVPQHGHAFLQTPCRCPTPRRSRLRRTLA